MRLFTLVYRNVTRRRIRSALTICGMAVAVAAVVALVGVADGFQRSFLGLYRGHGVDIVVVRARAADRMTSELDQSIGARMLGIDGVATVDPVLLDAISLEDAGLYGVVVQGVEPTHSAGGDRTLVAGRALAPDDQRAVMLGQILARNLGKRVGDRVEIYEGEFFDVVGIYDRHNIFENGSMIVPLVQLQGMLGQKGLVTAFNVTLRAPKNAAAINRVIEAIEKLGLGVSAMGTEDFVATDAKIQGARAMAWSTSFIALVMGAIGMLNTMIVSVFERTGEIIRRVVVPQIEGKSPLQVLGVKILDPACGSGSFLIAAYQYLVDHCLRYIAEHPNASVIPASENARKKTRKIAFRDPEGQWHLSPEFKADLVTSCIHGVDIDAQAVEVTIMSLYLKMLEGKLPSGWQKVWGDWRRLPPLDNNICCGNSLLSQADFDDYWEDKNGSLFAGDADEVRFRINAFDWNSQTRGFGRLLDEHKGFDCIIGNPPYIRVQELNKWAQDECAFYKWRYKSAAKGNYDIYVAFIERGLELLASGGLLGVICPHKYWQAAYGAGLRELIADGRHLRSIVDFADQQVFRGATTYTAIQIFSKGPSPKRVPVARLTELIDGDAQCTAIDSGTRTEGVTQFYAPAPPSLEPWHFEPASLAQHKEEVELAATLSLGEMADRMFQGIRTSLNEVFVVRCLDRRKAQYRSEYLSSTVELEHDLLRPFLSGEDIRRYYLIDSNQYVLIPYRRVRRSPIALVDTKEMQSRFPKTWKYLKSCESALRRRERGRMDHDQWYAFVYPKNLELFGEPRIVVRDIVQGASFALDADGQYAFVTGYGITLKKSYKRFLTYLLGLLNSKLLDRYLKSVSTTLRGGWFRPFPQFLKQLPIKLPESAAEKKVADRIAERVHRIIEVKKELQATGLGDRERERGEREVEAHENRINELVCRLYGVDEIPEE